ncbi:MAG TPA: class I SAM-dependent methyltransferase [Candidatus Angelobacter sp.]
MAEFDSRFAGSIPALYDRYLGPFIFEPYAADLAERLADVNEGKLLEVAAGTGVVTRTLACTLPENVAIVATDLNQPMLDFAAGQYSSPRVSWRQANAQSLPFPDGVFDAVVCQFGAMFFPDKIAAFGEALRVLKPGGRFIFSSWDRLEESEIPYAVSQGVIALFPDDPPRFLARIPHGYCDPECIESDVRQAGFPSVKLETVQLCSRASSHRDPAIGFCQGSPLRNEIEARAASRLAETTEAAAAAVKARFGTGPIEGKIQAHIITAYR